MAEENVIEEIIRKAKRIEEMGQGAQAAALLSELSVVNHAMSAELMIQKAGIEFRNGRMKEALLDYIVLYRQTANKEVFEMIDQAYIRPQEDVFREIYANNRRLLEAYPYTYGDVKETPSMTIIWADTEDIIAYDIATDAFVQYHNVPFSIETKDETAFLVCDVLFYDKLMMCADKSRMLWSVNGRMIPSYMLFTEEKTPLFLQVTDLTPMLQNGRFVFFFSEEDLQAFFRRDMVILPQLVIGETEIRTKQEDILVAIAKEKEERYHKDEETVKTYYKEHADEIRERINAERPRMFFWASRFTTAIQYHAINFARAAKKLGCETYVLIEKDSIMCIQNWELMHAVAEFRPDVMFLVNHFRFENPIFPDNLVYINWMQDEMDAIMDPNSCGKLLKTDILMNYMMNEPPVLDNYAAKHMIPGPIPANEEIYHPYELTEEEKEAYACDVCLVCHGGNADGYIEGVKDRYEDPDVGERVRKVYRAYADRAYHKGIFYGIEDFHSYVRRMDEGLFDIATATSSVGEEAAEDMFYWLNQRVFRQILVGWLLEAGIDNICLWGNEWKTSVKYQKYAMGPAENGETLSKILQASKISVGNNCTLTAAARTWESMLSGAFYLANYIPEEYDTCDMRGLIDKDAIVMFEGKEDFLAKVKYYLSHEKEREEMAEHQRQAALQNMTFTALAKRVLWEMPIILKEQESE